MQKSFRIFIIFLFIISKPLLALIVKISTFLLINCNVLCVNSYYFIYLTLATIRHKTSSIQPYKALVLKILPKKHKEHIEKTLFTNTRNSDFTRC